MTCNRCHLWVTEQATIIGEHTPTGGALEAYESRLFQIRNVIHPLTTRSVRTATKGPLLLMRAEPFRESPVRTRALPPLLITGTAESISMMTAKAVSRIRRPAATLGTRETGPSGCSPSLRQFPAERGTNGD